MTETMPVATVAAHKPQPLAVTKSRDILEFATIAEVIKFAELIQNAEGAIPKHCLRNPGKIVATVMAGHELGIGPMASLRAFHVVEGKPTADYSFWIARLKAAGYRIEWPELSPEKVTLKLTAPDGSSATDSWTKAKAIAAGLWNGKDNWRKYPQTMLQARVVTSLGRAFAGEVMFGCYEHDEADEIVRQAQVTVTDAAGPSQPTGTVAERVGSAIGNAVDKENAATERKASECVDMLRALGMDRAGLLALLKELGIEHTDKTRVAELSRDALEKLAERLDTEAARRGDGGPTNPPPGREPKGGTQREPGDEGGQP